MSIGVILRLFILVTQIPHPHVHHHHGVPEVWKRLAQCESTGNWHDTAGLFSGGLQFTQESWDSEGGQRFAPTAAQATPMQQVIVARRLRAVQGWHAWPVCSVKIGVA